MSAQDTVNKASRELESLSLTDANTFISQRNQRFRRLLAHHVHNAHNTAYAELWRDYGLDTQRHGIDFADVERLPLVDRQFLKKANYADHPAVSKEKIGNLVNTSGTTTGVPLSFPLSYLSREFYSLLNSYWCWRYHLGA